MKMCEMIQRPIRFEHGCHTHNSNTPSQPCEREDVPSRERCPSSPAPSGQDGSASNLTRSHQCESQVPSDALPEDMLHNCSKLVATQVLEHCSEARPDQPTKQGSFKLEFQTQPGNLARSLKPNKMHHVAEPGNLLSRQKLRHEIGTIQRAFNESQANALRFRVL